MSATEGPSQEDRGRVRAYILNQAARYEPADYWPRLVESRTQLLRMLDDLTSEQAAWRPPAAAGEEAWSAIEVAQHVRQWTDYTVAITRVSIEGTDLDALPVGFIAPDPTATLPEVRRALIEASQRLGDALLHDAGRADPERTVEHGWFGPLTARQWFVMTRVHDLDHVRQVEGLRQAAGFPSADE